MALIACSVRVDGSQEEPQSQVRSLNVPVPIPRAAP